MTASLKPSAALIAQVVLALAIAALAVSPGRAGATDGDQSPPKDEADAIHAQATFIDQGTLDFHAPYAGPNSLTPLIGRETFNATLFAGFRPWPGAEIWANPEIDQGFGLDDTEGVAGFPNGQGAKVGKSTPYFRLPRLFLRQTIDLGGEVQKVDPDENQLGGSQTANRLVLWVGKFDVVDVFDTNQYAHDPANDFLNWSLIDTGSFDYAADAWGYTHGMAAEWYQGRWTVRAGVFDLSTIPNSADLDPSFGQVQYVGELEERHTIAGQDGRLMLTGFLTRGRMASFADALRLAALTGRPPNVADVRRYQSRPGLGLELEQSLKGDLGLFARAGVADGDLEPYEYADIDQTLATGLFNQR